MSTAIAQQLALVFMGRSLDTQWASSTANLLNGGQPSVALQTAFYNSAVAEGVFSTSDSPSGLVNDIFQNIFGFGASTFEQTAWGNLITNGTLTKETAAWTIFKSYLGATNVPDAYKLPAQSKLVAMNAYSTELAADAEANLALAGGGKAAAAARAYVSGVTSQATAATAISGVAASVDALPTASAPTYTLTSSAASVNEGGAINFTLAATNVAAGTQQAYTITGVNSADVVGGSLSGVATIGADGKAVISVTLAADATTEGAETLTMAVAGKSAAVTVADTSTTPVPTYALAADAASVNEGGTATFTLTTTNVAAGSMFDYTLSGVSAADVVGGALTGTATVGTDGKAVISVGTVADSLTEGAETMTLAVAGKSAAVTVADTSTTPVPTYALAADAASVNEGSTVVYTLTTTNVAAGTTFAYMLSGVTASDVLGGSLTGTATVDSNGKAMVSVALLADTLSEGAETLTIALAGLTASTTVVDTSTSSFTLTTGVDTLSGTALDDVFIADNTVAVVTSTADSINGGGGIDTLAVFSVGTAFAMPALTSVETLNIYDQEDSVTLAAGQDSLTTVNLLRGDGDLTLTVRSNVTTVGLTDIVANGTAGAGVIIGAAATATALNVNLNGITASGGGFTDDNVDINGAALTTVTVNTATTASNFDDLDVASATTIAINAAVGLTVTALETGATAAALTITGAGAVSLGTLDTAINTVTASTATGALTAAIGAAVDTVLTAGSANDVITASTEDTIATTDTLAVNAGDGTADILIILEAADVSSTADGGRYTNFETVRVDGSYDGDNIASITALQIIGTTASQSYTDLTATQAANIQVRGDTTSATFALKTATGSADVLTLTMGTGLTTSAATDIVTGMTVTGFETLNVIENGGATAAAGADRTAVIAAVTGATLNDINLSGRAVTVTNIATTVAVDIDGSALTGNGASSGAQGLTVGGSAVVGSVITGSAVRDSFTIGAEGSTYDGGTGNDAFSATAALIAADGITDLVLKGGVGTDTLTLTNTTGNTLTDLNFTNLSGFEALTLTNTGAGDTSITTGGSFNAAFASGATITSGLIAAAQDITIAAGLATVALTVVIAATSQTGAATETNSIITGSAADTVTYTDTDFVGVGGAAQGSIVIDTRAGNDTISVTTGTLLASTSVQAVTITGGAGQDSITRVGVNSTTVTSVTHFAFAAGDSSTTASDSITGFDLSDGTKLSDGLNFEGTAAVSAFTSTVDFGIIKSHSVTAGIVQFDDVADYSTALVINATNLQDVVGYLQANVAANGTVAFLYDNNADGTTDATMVFHQGSGSTVADDLVLLVGITTADALVTTNAAGANDLFIF